MAIKKVEVTLTGTYVFTYNPESSLFQQTLEDYKESMDSTATEEDLLKNVAHQLRLRGDASSMLEGIGYIAKKGITISSGPMSGITVIDDDPMYDCELNEI